MLNGAASREAMAGSGAISVTGAGLAMLVQVLRLESQPPARARFHELVVDHAVAGDDRNEDPAQTRTPAQVVRALGELAGRARRARRPARVTLLSWHAR